jgi:hypothetical protein
MRFIPRQRRRRSDNHFSQPDRQRSKVASKRRLAFEALERRSVLASDLSDGGLLIDVIPAYNLVIDSNVETPATYAPTAAHLGVKVTNVGTTPLSDIEVNFGSFDVLTGAGTPGIYPVTTIPESDPIRDYWGNFSFVHEGGVIDATRPVVNLAPGESMVIYVLVSYPNLDERGKTVAGAAPVVEDDLRLDYDVWATASQGLSEHDRQGAGSVFGCDRSFARLATCGEPTADSWGIPVGGDLVRLGECRRGVRQRRRSVTRSQRLVATGGRSEPL